jgi:hypothetical protein
MKRIEISEETYNRIKDQLPGEDYNFTSFKDLIGKKFFFRTVTYHLVGEVVGQLGQFLRLQEASWVAESGRFMNAIQDGVLNEVEPVGIAFINMETVTDFFPWKHGLPKEQK